MAGETNIRGYSAFGTLYNQGYAALKKIENRRDEAEAQHDNQLSLSLLAEWTSINQALDDMRSAEVAVLTSAAPDEGATAVARLNKIIADARQRLEELEELARALAAAQRFVTLLTRMIALA